MKIVVLAGGLSPERDVSLSTGSMVANSLISSGNEVVMVDVYEGIKNCDDLGEMFNKYKMKKYEYIVKTREPNLDEIRKINDNRKVLIGPNVLNICAIADVVFIALHGAMGENGQLQALLEIYDIKYTGSNYIGCLLAIDKDLSKRMMVMSNIPTPAWKMIDTEENINLHELPYPCFVKPCSCGSSVGISRVSDMKEMEKALEIAKRYERYVLVEKEVCGREFSVGILDGKALPVIEIIPKSGFYDYENKYQSGLTEEVCPAHLDELLTNKIMDYAVYVHKTLRLGAYSRIDFILNEEDEFMCLEANTLPGMTPTSLLPQAAAVAGITFDELCKIMIDLALA